MAAKKDARPIIVKRIKKVAGGHHGGAWKVAYADFVTAMMAFFLLLWLLSTSSKETLQGLADYFTPTIGLRDEMGIGFEGGTSSTEDGVAKSDRTPPGAVPGAPQSGIQNKTPEEKAIVEGEKEAALFQKAEDEMRQAFESDPNLRDYADNIIVQQTPEGLSLQVIDDGRQAMFEAGGAVLTPFGKDMLQRLTTIIRKLPNRVSITGHTDASLQAEQSGYSNWELSAERANSARRHLVKVGMEAERVSKVTGRAEQELLLPDRPRDARNRRIAITLLRGSHLLVPEKMSSAPRTLRDKSSAPRPVEEPRFTPQDSLYQQPLQTGPAVKSGPIGAPNR